MDTILHASIHTLCYACCASNACLVVLYVSNHSLCKASQIPSHKQNLCRHVQSSYIPIIDIMPLFAYAYTQC